MPVQPTYPGVYIEEIPSGVRTITGVATSITAFIGRAFKGDVDEPVTITSFGDYERLFGGLWVDSTMSYAVQDFYQNGGSMAIIVRIYKGRPGSPLDSGIATLTLTGSAGALNLYANSPGEWGNNLYASVNYATKDPTQPPPSPGGGQTTFNLLIYEKIEGVFVKQEEYLNASFDENDLKYLPRLLEQRSDRLNIRKKPDGTWDIPGSIPSESAVDANNNAIPVQASGGSDGVDLTPTEYLGSENDKTGIYALKKADLFNLLCIPPPVRGANTSSSVYSKAVELCVGKRAMLIVDPPAEWASSVSKAVSNPIDNLSTLGVTGTDARNAALYYPLIKKPDPLRDNQTDLFVPCGAVAGLMAKTDTNRGVWKAPAGNDAGMSGVQGLQINLSDLENGQLNKLGINCLRSFPLTGRVIWGARTMRGADQLADEWKYVPVRRTALFIEESLFRGTQWVVFEPNDEPLWAQIRLNVGAFMHNLFRQGAFQGQTPRDAYLVKCDKETTTQNDINAGIVNILVGFAPLKPAEFVIIKIQQLAGQIES
ncbi:MAG TPA: phage tail sheath subtilisin-like domain-containing protein [Cyclobacteriaceae bacterium]|jgi:Bacteriophage tail sheath protein|nr:phage tail sheath subtilisin-like domain-containing protein [Cyclobacteriaceae bacterium]